MVGKSLIRSIKRPFATGVVWAMIPLAAVSGMPVTRCACELCRCGANCAIGSQCSGNCSSAAESPAKRACCSCCCGHCSCAPGHCCCCSARKAAESSKVCHKATGEGFSGPSANGCRVSVTATPVVRVTTVIVSDHLPLAVDIVATAEPAQLLASADLRSPLNTGPPPDIVVTLCRLVI
jgi:hypothetical protein